VAPLVTVVIPTRDRPRLLAEAVESALAQSVADTRVLVVDDGSDPPVTLPPDPRLTVVRHPRSRGVSAARNTGTNAASTPYVAFLDDDDRLRARMVEVSVEGIESAALPAPVGVLSGIAVVDEAGGVIETRIPPPARSRGAHFSLEPLEPGYSYFTKQTLVAPRPVLAGVGGFDETFLSRGPTEMFWRLNAVCSLRGLPTITYDLRSHSGPRISGDPTLRRRSFDQLVAKHAALLRAHPEGYAELLAQHARNCLAAGQPLGAARAVARQVRVSPRRALAGAGRTARDLARR
jgi:glycosyltransferase involved in cell wall biosynthesis